MNAANMGSRAVVLRSVAQMPPERLPDSHVARPTTQTNLLRCRWEEMISDCGQSLLRHHRYRDVRILTFSQVLTLVIIRYLPQRRSQSRVPKQYSAWLHR